MSWFEDLTGFQEGGYDATREQLEVVGDRLHSKVNRHSYGIGHLDVVSLGELRRRSVVAGVPTGKLKLSTVSGDVRRMHREPAFANGLFQVASQFNLLEMTGPQVTPEHGVTRYESDPTQGPACAIAAGAATIYRNYFVPLSGEIGQTADRQIDCLGAIGEVLGNEGSRLWRMQNGYALCTTSGLREIRTHLSSLSEQGRDDIRAKLSVGVHWNVEVTDQGSGGPLVSQAFCSALPVAYCAVDPREWAEFASLTLEAAYEATLWAACLNARNHGSNVVLLTRLGGGAFGNEPDWIQSAMRRALERFRAVDLDVQMVCRWQPDGDQRALVEEFG